MKLYRFTKEERICRRNDFETLFKQGESFFSYPFRCVYITREAPEFAVKVAISVPKRKFKHAVNRNRIKRVAKECFRLQKDIFYSSLKEEKFEILLLLIYVGEKNTTTKAILPQCKALFSKIIKNKENLHKKE